MTNNVEKENCIYNILKITCMLQNNILEKSTIGNCNLEQLHILNEKKANTRPLIIYNSLGNTFEVALEPQNYLNKRKTIIFRIEKIDKECATFRALDLDENGIFFVTNIYITLNISCIYGITCLRDCLIDCI